jgi:uncharacterized membrane protein YkvA (DUF1232 family)
VTGDGPGRSSGIRDRLTRWALAVRREVMVVHLAARDPRVPWYAKLLAVATVAYAVSPIDLIPDFIPVVGFLDDLVMLPLIIVLVLRLVPADVLSDLRRQAAQPLPRRSRAAAVAIVLLWLAALAAVAAPLARWLAA